MDENCDDEEDCPALNGVLNGTAESVHLRKERGKRAYYEMEPIHVCAAIGVTIKFLSGIHFWGREAYLSTSSAFADAESELYSSQSRAVYNDGNGAHVDETELDRNGDVNIKIGNGDAGSTDGNVKEEVERRSDDNNTGEHVEHGIAIESDEHPKDSLDERIEVCAFSDEEICSAPKTPENPASTDVGTLRATVEGSNNGGG